MYPIRIFLFAIAFLTFGLVHGQENCRSTLVEAGQLYNQGLIDEIPELLAPCMEEGFTRAEMIEAYKLVILAYLFDDDRLEAEKMMDEFLQKYPEYDLMPNDPKEFEYLFESYKTSAVISASFQMGTLLSMPSVRAMYSTFDQNSIEDQARPGMGFLIGVGASREFDENWAAHVELLLSIHNYTFKQASNSVYQSETYEFGSVELKETMNKIDIPITATYSFGEGDIKYYLRGGMGIGFISKVKGDFVRSHSLAEYSVSANDYDLKDLRAGAYFYGVLGGGISYKVPRGNLNVGLRLHFGANNLVKTEQRYSDDQLLSRYAHVDNDFSLNYLSLNIAYNLSFYQSKKK